MWQGVLDSQEEIRLKFRGVKLVWTEVKILPRVKFIFAWHFREEFVDKYSKITCITPSHTQ